MSWKDNQMIRCVSKLDQRGALYAQGNSEQRVAALPKQPRTSLKELVRLITTQKRAIRGVVGSHPLGATLEGVWAFSQARCKADGCCFSGQCHSNDVSVSLSSRMLCKVPLAQKG